MMSCSMVEKFLKLINSMETWNRQRMNENVGVIEGSHTLGEANPTEASDDFLQVDDEDEVVCQDVLATYTCQTG